MQKQHQQIIGYILGGLIVLCIIPFGIYSATKQLEPLIAMRLFRDETLKIALAIAFAMIGMFFGMWSIVVQNQVGKGGPLQIGNIEISPKTQNLVVTGPYRYTRNPMLFGACLMYFAFAVWLNSVVAIMIVGLFMIGMLFFVKLSEEKRLSRDFGQAYETYRGAVSMFIPWIPKREWAQKKSKDPH